MFFGFLMTLLLGIVLGAALVVIGYRFKDGFKALYKKKEKEIDQWLKS